MEHTRDIYNNTYIYIRELIYMKLLATPLLANFTRVRLVVGALEYLQSLENETADYILAGLMAPWEIFAPRRNWRKIFTAIYRHRTVVN